MEITKDWIAQQRAVCNAATVAPWSWNGDVLTSHWTSVISVFDNEGGASFSLEIDESDRAFIALSRTAYPAALTEIERLQKVAGERYTEIELLRNLVNAAQAFGDRLEWRTAWRCETEKNDRLTREIAALRAQVDSLTRERDAAASCAVSIAHGNSPCDTCENLPMCAHPASCPQKQYRDYEPNIDAPEGAGEGV